MYNHVNGLILYFAQGRMGFHEIQDQVLGLTAASKYVDFVDLSRVGIMGWSYGGYLSLMALAQYSHIFKVHCLPSPLILILG